MAQDESFISEILGRKIPQIIGMYIASVWLAVEISDWMSGRFDLSAQFSTYVFVGMMVLLPAVILLAWGHGRKGKDSWSILEKMILPVNLVVAILAVIFLVKPVEVAVPQPNKQSTQKNAMKEMAVVDVETGKKVTYEVADEAFHQNVVSYFWDNETGDETLDWLSYGASWLINQDLKRTPVISAYTPYDSDDLFNQLKQKGFKKGLNIPLSLARNIAEKKSADWIVRGTISNNKVPYTFTAQLYDVETGEMVKSISSNHENWLTALDTIADGLSKQILTATKITKNIIPKVTIVEHTSDNLQAIKLLIESMNAVTFENDFKEAIKYLKQALEVDPSFAEAHVQTAKFYNGIGDYPHAIESALKALEYDYKLYQETVFFVKAHLYSLQSKQDKSIKVYENWVKLYPNSVEALYNLGWNYVLIGNHQEQAKEVYQKLYELEGPGHKALIELGKIYRLQNNKEKALEYLTKYLEANPTKGIAYFQLAAAYKQFALLDKAKEMYEEASLYENRDYQSEIGLANITASEGDYETAISQLYSLLEKSKSDNQKLMILGSISELYLQTGQMLKVIDLLEEIKPIAQNVMVPISYTFQVQAANIIYFTELGRFEDAKELTEVVLNKLTPPLDKLIATFTKYIHERQNNIEKFRQDVEVLEEVMKEMKMLTMEPDILSSKSKLAFWQNDFKKALDFNTQAINLTTQSFVTLFTTKQIDGLSYEKADILLQMKKYQEGIDVLNVLLMRTPLFAKAHYLKARIYHQMEKFEERDVEIIKAHTIWKNADNELLDLQELISFEESLKL